LLESDDMAVLSRDAAKILARIGTTAEVSHAPRWYGSPVSLVSLRAPGRRQGGAQFDGSGAVFARHST
jgi:hypothetical protein